MSVALIGLLLPCVAMWLWLRALRVRLSQHSHAVTGALGCALAVGLSSITTFCFVTFGGSIGPAFVIADAGAWSALAVLAWRRIRRGAAAPQSSAPSPSTEAHRSTVWDWLACAAFCVVAAIAAATVMAEYQAAPHGQWDAWAIWNQKARFVFRSGPEWTASLAIPWSQPSHPLMVPMSIARLWGYAGAELTIVPATFAALLGVAIVAAVIGALDARRARAWLAGSVLVAAGVFPQQAAAQTSDLPVALFVTLTLIMLPREDAAWRHAPSLRRSLVLAGVLGGLCAWTKNEGLVLSAIVTVLVLWRSVRVGRVRETGWWLAGLTPMALFLAWLKLVVARTPPEYLAAGDSTTLAERLLSPERYALLGDLLTGYWARWGGPGTAGVLPLVCAAAVATALSRRGRAVRPIVATVFTMAIAYHVVWTVSAMDTTWLLATSFERVVFQLWPSLVLCAFSLTFRDDAAARVDPVASSFAGQDNALTA